MVELTREENDIIAEHQELINTLNRYDSTRKVKELSKIGLKKVAKKQNILENELNRAKNCKKKTIDELKGIARFRRIKNSEKLTKEDLITTLLK